MTSARCSRRAASVALRIAPSDRLQKPISRPPDALIRTGNPSVIESETSRIRRESKSQDARRPQARLRVSPSRAARPGDVRRTTVDHPRTAEARDRLTGHELTSRRARNCRERTLGLVATASWISPHPPIAREPPVRRVHDPSWGSACDNRKDLRRASVPACLTHRKRFGSRDALRRRETHGHSR